MLWKGQWYICHDSFTHPVGLISGSRAHPTRYGFHLLGYSLRSVTSCMMALSSVTHTLRGLLGHWEHRGAPAKGTRPSRPGHQPMPPLRAQQASVLNSELPALKGAAMPLLAVRPGSRHPPLRQSISSHKLPERVWHVTVPRAHLSGYCSFLCPNVQMGQWKFPGALLVPHACGGICPSLSSFRVATWDLAGRVSALTSLSRQVGAGQGMALGPAGGGCAGHTPRSRQQASPCLLRPRALPLLPSS